MTLEDYCQEHSSLPQSEALEWIERTTHLRTNHARMLSGRDVGGLLSAISRMMAPQRILEVGVFTGYSTVCLAEGLAAGGSIDAIEINDELEDIIREGYSRAGISDKVNLLLGDALEIIPTLTATYDMVYIDANKRFYPQFWEMIIDKVRPGGVIIADNTLWDGKVTDGSHDPQSRGIQAFNDAVKADRRAECLMLPLRDGLTIVVKN
ncbi:MAG: O-methyltransferase [Bacteroidales bacterium]|nr:O-methyltransferase [Bacteroidales bacterium]